MIDITGIVNLILVVAAAVWLFRTDRAVKQLVRDVAQLQAQLPGRQP